MLTELSENTDKIQIIGNNCLNTVKQTDHYTEITLLWFCVQYSFFNNNRACQYVWTRKYVEISHKIPKQPNNSYKITIILKDLLQIIVYYIFININHYLLITKNVGSIIKNWILEKNFICIIYFWGGIIVNFDKINEGISKGNVSLLKEGVNELLATDIKPMDIIEWE